MQVHGFAKILAPGIRLGWLCGRREMIDAVAATRVDPYGDTDKVGAEVRASLALRATADAQASRQQRNLTILLAIAASFSSAALRLGSSIQSR